MCLAQGPQRSDAGEARTRGPSVSSQALYHWATSDNLIYKSSNREVNPSYTTSDNLIFISSNREVNHSYTSSDN